MNGACHCGRVTIAVPGRPAYLNACNCTLCTKLGALWGYFPVSEVTFGGERQSYVRGDKAQPGLSAHFCGACGATTNWSSLRPGEDRIGVNMRLFEPAELTGVEVRYGDRRNAERAEPRRYYRESTVFDGLGTEI